MSAAASHEAWEDARQKRNEAATRFIWTTQGTSPNEQAGWDATDPHAAKYLAEFYRWDGEMDRINAELAKADADPV